MPHLRGPAEGRAKPSAARAPGVHSEGSSGVALPPAQGVQAFSGSTERQGQSNPAEQSDNRPLSWPQLLLNGVPVILSLGLFTVSSTRLWSMLHAWRSPDVLAATGFRRRAMWRGDSGLR